MASTALPITTVGTSRRATSLSKTRSRQPTKTTAPATTERPETASLLSGQWDTGRTTELEALPARIAALEQEHRDLLVRTEDPGFYKEGGSIITTTLQRIDEARKELDAAYARWDELESKG